MFYKAGFMYCVTAYEDCTISINGEIFLTLEKGSQDYFTCPSDSATIECSSDNVKVTRVFKCAPASGGGTNTGTSSSKSATLENGALTLSAGKVNTLIITEDTDIDTVNLGSSSSTEPTAELSVLFDITAPSLTFGDAQLVDMPDSIEGLSFARFVLRYDKPSGNLIVSHAYTVTAADMQSFAEAYKGTPITSATIVNEIADDYTSAFEDCTELTTVTLTPAYTDGNCAVAMCKGCTALTSFTTLSETCWTNAQEAFSGCTALTDFSADLDMLIYGDNMFDNCPLSTDTLDEIIGNLPTVTPADATQYRLGMAGVTNLTSAHITTATAKGWTIINE